MQANHSGRLTSSNFNARRRGVKRPSLSTLRHALARLLVFVLVWQAVLTPVSLANGRGASAAKTSRKAGTPLAPLLPVHAGSSILLFGPRQFSYLPGPARNVYESFTLPISAPVAGTVRIENGASGGANRVTGATIFLNGALLSTARNFNLTTTALELPASLLASNALSVRILGQPGAFLTVTILAKPVITALAPTSAIAGSTITINGDYFDDSGTAQNIIRFTKSGGGQTTAQVTTATRAQLSVIVPGDAATGPVSVQTAGGTATSPGNFTLLTPQPVITDFNPKRGTVGASVTLTGSNLKIGATNPAVTFAGANNTRLPALVTLAADTQVIVTVPNASVSGPIELTTSAGTTTTGNPFILDATQDFQITAAPGTATTIQGSVASFVISLTSSEASFSQLATLSVQNAPAGSTATFNPNQITAGATTTLSLRTAAGLTPNSYSFTVNATATINGVQVTRSAPATVIVQVAGQTALSGRVLSTLNEPILGATISLDGKTTTTDAAGTFLLSGVNAGQNRPLVVDGRTANAPNRTYPAVTEAATVIAGQVNVIRDTYYLPPIDVGNEVTIVPGIDTMATTPKLTGYQMMIPAGANLRNLDGTPVARMSITSLPIDRIPAPLPANVTTAMVLTAQPGGAMSDMPMPVTYPNLMHADPGTRCELYSFDHNAVRWVVYGYGRVSADGRLIVPENDPSTGKPYGLRDFAWHFTSPPDAPFVSDKGNPVAPEKDPCAGSNVGSNPVSYSSGVKLEVTTDVAFGGARGGLGLTRVYTSDLARQNIQGRFGRGTRDNYAISLTGTFLVNGAGRIVMPDEGMGRQFSYLRTDPDGALIFGSTETVTQLGDTVRKLTSGAYEYRMVSGELYRFDTNRRLIEMEDRNGNITTLAYSGNNLTQVTDPVGRSLTFSYDGNGFVSQVTDPLNRRWTYSYTGTQFTGIQLASVTDPLGYTQEYTYDALWQLTSVKDKRGIVVKRITYNADGRVISQQFADGGTETYEYTLSGTIVTGIAITDPLGRITRKRLSPSGYVIGMDDALGQSTTVERTIDTNLPTQLKGPCGCPETTRQFDPRGNIIANTDRLNKTTNYVYEPTFNNLTNFTDKLNRATNMAYDARGNLKSITNALNQTTILAYDSFGQMTSITDALNHTTTLEYDAQGNVTAVINPLGNRTTMQYDAVGRLTAVIDPLNRRSETTYDDLDRVLMTKDQSGAVTRFAYDGNGNQTSVTNALNRQWVNNYDKKNRLVAAIDPLNRTTRFTYDLADQLTRVTSPSNRKVSYGYDARGQRATITDGIGGVIRFTYDNRGNLATLSDQRGNTMTFAYDELFRLVEQTDPLGRKTNFSHDAEGNVITVVDRLGRAIAGEFDAVNRRTRVSYADATVTYSYDAAGRMTRVSDTLGGAIDWAYDNADRLVSEMTPQGVVSYGYNAAGQRTTMAATGAPAVNYGYDTAGRLRTITQGSETFTYAYDTLSRMQSLLRPNGVTTSYQYDAVNRLARLTHTTALNAALEDLQYSYNAEDEITSITSLAAATLLTTAKTATAADAANRIPQFGGANYGFDLEGQTTSKTDGQGATAYNWDARGRLTSATLPSGQSVNYSYDALGRRMSRTAGGVTTSFLYDGADVVRDTDGGVVDYVNGPGIDQKLRQTGAGGAAYFLQDHLGSTLALTNAAGGVVERAQYEAFGASAGLSGTRYGFTGREREAVGGLLFYRARWMDAGQGRFLSEDGIGLRGGLNLHLYVDNNPFSFNDPNGEFFQVALAMLIGAAISGTIDVGLQLAENDFEWECIDWTQAGISAGLGAFGSGIGARSLVRAAGKEWSHWIPARFSNPKSRFYKGIAKWITESPLNGNFVSPKNHALNDPFRYRFMPKAWKLANSINSEWMRQFNRIPDWLKGTGLGAALGVGGSDPNCKCKR